VAEKDWSKELAKVDKQLASLSDEELLGPAPTAPAAKAAAAAPPKGGAAAPATKATTTNFGVYARLLLSVALGIGMVVWPYEARCGVGLAAYLAATVAVVGSGVWSAVWTWRHRASRTHSLSLLLILWGLVLGSLEVLPRIGYAKPDANHPATWACK
jgi:hypothetical protein